MNPLTTIILASWLAGLASFCGGLIAYAYIGKDSPMKRELSHGIIAFGGGILFAAVAFALVPEAMDLLPPFALGGIFCAGGIVFCIVDAYLSKKGGTKSQFLAMIMDFIPEAIALGAVFGHNRKMGLLLAAFIGAQNLPEGFNAFRELTKSSHIRSRSALRALLAISFLGPVAACTGHFFLQDMEHLTAGIMTFAAGGITYLVFQDIAPQSTLRKHWTPTLGAVLGFAIGMIGKQILH